MKRRIVDQLRLETFDLSCERPQDVPALRLMLIAGWRPGGPYYSSTLLRAAIYGDGNPMSPVFDMTALRCAQLWWATHDMTELVEHAAKTLPETTLDDTLPPCDWGLVVFARPLIDTDAENGSETYTHALLWGPTVLSPDPDKIRLWDGDGPELRDGERRALTISTYSRMSPPKSPTEMWVGEHDEHGPWVPLGRGDWLWGTDTTSATFDDENEQRQLSMEEDRRWLAALWLISSQRRVADDVRSVRPARSLTRERRHLPRELVKLVDSNVRLIDVRRPEPSSHHESSTRRPSRYRVIVGEEQGGFWRQQAYGPHWSLRRPQWIDAFVRGPADAPLRVRDTVRVVKGDA